MLNLNNNKKSDGRTIKNLISKHIENFISQQILDKKINKNNKFKIFSTDNKIKISKIK